MFIMDKEKKSCVRFSSVKNRDSIIHYAYVAFSPVTVFLV